MIVGNPIITGAEYREYYTGDYSIDPAIYSQVLSVSGKTMAQDITINAFVEGNGVGDLIARSIEGFDDVGGVIPAVGAYAFYSCTFLYSVTFPRASRIGSYAFYECTTLRKVSAPSADRIFEYAFGHCQ